MSFRSRKNIQKYKAYALAHRTPGLGLCASHINTPLKEKQTESDAWLAAVRWHNISIAEGNDQWKYVNYYQCDSCNYWHSGRNCKPNQKTAFDPPFGLIVRTLSDLCLKRFFRIFDVCNIRPVHNMKKILKWAF